MITRADLIASAEPTSDRMLAPSAYSEALLPSLRLARSSQVARRVGKVLLVLLVVGFGFVAVAPWQQSISGSGKVIAPNPEDQPQTIEAPIKGRIAYWGDGIQLNAIVKKGDLIAEIVDIDPLLKTRLDDQVAAAKAQVKANELFVAASQQSTLAAKQAVESNQALLTAYELARTQIIASAEADIASAQNKIEAEQQELEELNATLTQVKLDAERQDQLFKENLVSGYKAQLAERKYLETKAKIEKANAKISAARNALTGKKADRDGKEQKASADIAYAANLLVKAGQAVAKAESDVAKAESELEKAKQSLLEKQSKAAQQASQTVTATCDGQITYIAPNQGTQMLKAGDSLCTIVPQTSERAVAIMLDGNDAPLVAPGRHVRLQFEGWPAVQFAGWPSVAIGTFGGEVISVDATDDGKGKFRVLVEPHYDNIVNWESSDATNVTAIGNSLRFAAAGGTSPEAFRSQKVSKLGYSDNYALNFSVDSASDMKVMLGLHETKSDATDMDFAICLNNGLVTVYESGQSVMEVGSYSAGDDFSIEIRDETLQYLHNDKAFRTIAIDSGKDYYVDSLFYSSGSEYSIDDIRLTNPWPHDRYLRQGVRTNGWVLLEQVPLWYEIWRNMNGFPPVVDQEVVSKNKSKPPKLPK